MTTLLEQRLARIVFEYWAVPAYEGQRLVSVLLRSSCSRVVTLRQQLSVAEVTIPTVQGLRPVDMNHVFKSVVTPTFTMQLLTDLRATHSLSSRQVSKIENAILECVDAKGQWRAV